MVAGAIAGNISAEATTPTGNTFAEAMRAVGRAVDQRQKRHDERARVHRALLSCSSIASCRSNLSSISYSVCTPPCKLLYARVSVARRRSVIRASQNSLVPKASYRTTHYSAANIETPDFPRRVALAAPFRECRRSLLPGGYAAKSHGSGK